MAIGVGAGRLQGPHGGGVGVGSPCTLLSPASSLVSSSDLDSFFAVLQGWLERALSPHRFPTSFFVLSTVCFLPPYLMCVSFLVAVFTLHLCLVCESDSRDMYQEGLPKHRG